MPHEKPRSGVVANRRRRLLLGEFFCLLSLLLCPSRFFPAQGGNIRFTHYTQRQGLSENSVAAIIQDQDGFLWIATLDGLNRFDGYSFTIFRSQADDPNSLPENQISDLLLDHAGELWVATHSGGLCRFNRHSGNFVVYRHRPGDPGSLSSDHVNAIAEDRQGNLWVGTSNGGLNRLDLQRKKFTTFHANPRLVNALSSDNIDTLYIDRQNLLWIGTVDNGLNCLNVANNKFLRYANQQPGGNLLVSDSISAIVEDHWGNLWIGTRGSGLLCLDSSTGIYAPLKKAESAPADNSRILALYEDSSGILWVGSGSGLYMLDQTTGTWQHTTHNEGDASSLGSDIVLSLYEDQQGILWVGTYSGGLSQWDRHTSQFANIKHQNGNPKSLSHNIVIAISEDDANNLWLGTYGGGVNCYNPKSGFFRHYVHDKNDEKSISQDLVSALAIDGQGHIWIGTLNRGLNRLDPQSGKSLRYRYLGGDKQGLSSDRIECLLIDHLGTVWIGTSGSGLNRLDAGEERFLFYRHDINNYRSLSLDIISVLYEDQAGIIWVGTDGGGLNRLDRQQNSFVHFRHDPANPRSLSQDRVMSMFEAQDGSFWIGTSGGGLNRFDRAQGVFTSYTTVDGLANDTINAITEDERENLWLSTNAGLTRFHKQDKRFRNFDLSDGLQAGEYILGSCCRTRAGKIVFGGMNGVDIFSPADIQDKRNSSPVRLTSFAILNNFVPQFAPLPEVQLTYRQNTLAFEFATLDFRNPQENRYNYKLAGFDRDWIRCGNRRYAAYTNLPPGNYLFQVKGTNSDGVWSESGLSVKVHIIPPFWQTRWFQVLAVFLALGLLAGFSRIRKKSLKQAMAREKLENELRLKTDLTAMLVHDLRNPLQCMAGYAELMRRKSADELIRKGGDVITRSANTMLNLINDMLDIFKFEANQMKIVKEMVRLDECVENTLTLMMPLLQNASLGVAPQIASLPPLPADPVRIGQVIDNLIANAVKFSPRGGTIVVSLDRVQHNSSFFQEFAVSDEGPGISPDKQEQIFNKYAQLQQQKGPVPRGTGLGLAVSRLIVEAHGGVIGYKPGKKSGSIFFFRLPEWREGDTA